MIARWVVQLNLGKDDDALRIKDECVRLGQPCEMLNVIPFSETLPNVSENMPTIFYGGTNWIHSINKSGIWKPGAWFDEENFRFSTMLEKYKENVLNFGARVTTFKEFVDWADVTHVNDEDLFFIRPDRDAKEFAGDVIRFGDFHDWYDRISHGNFTLTSNTAIVVAEPVGIAVEWRCFMVNSIVSSASRYRSNRILDVGLQVPPDVIEFAQAMANIWSPSDVFVMDVCKSGDSLYVVENNCFNSSGFYASNIEKVVRDASDEAERAWFLK